MASFTLTRNIDTHSTTETPLKTYEKAVYVAFGSIRLKVTEENSDAPKLQVVLQAALVNFVEDLGKSDEKAKSRSIQIDEVRRLMNSLRETPDDDLNARLTTLKRAEDVLNNTEKDFCNEVRKGVEDFQDKLVGFQESNVKEAKIEIKQRAAELDSQQKRLGNVTPALEAVDAQAVGEAIAIAVPAKEYHGVVSLLARFGFTIAKTKGQDEIDRRRRELGQAQQDCGHAIASIDSFDAAAKSAWSSLDGCETFPIAMQEFIHQLRMGLLILRKPAIPPGSVDYLERQWSRLSDMVNGYQTTVSNILEVAPLFEERSMSDEVEAFGRRVTGLYNIFKQLCTAEDIVEDAHRTLLLTKVHELSECIVKQLAKIQEVFVRWHAYSNSESLGTFYFVPEILDMTCHINSFAWSVQPIYAQINRSLREGFHRKKAKKAQEKREREHQIGVSEIQGFHCLVSEAEALVVLEQVDVILKGIAQFSTEFGAALLYFDGRRGGGAGRAAIAGGPSQPSSSHPKNPFKVPREITEQVMSTLRSETSRLSQLSGLKN